MSCGLWLDCCYDPGLRHHAVQLVAVRWCAVLHGRIAIRWPRHQRVSFRHVVIRQSGIYRSSVQCTLYPHAFQMFSAKGSLQCEVPFIRRSPSLSLSHSAYQLRRALHPVPSMIARQYRRYCRCSSGALWSLALSLVSDAKSVT